MLKKSRIGLVIWGSIFAIVGASELISSLFSQTKYMVIAIILLVGGAGMIVGGMFNVTKISKENKAFLEKYKDCCLLADCPHCHYKISADLKTSFATHRNYPEGFLYCPICKKPISKRAFQIVPKETISNGH